MAGKYQVSRRTVRAALQSAWPQPRKPMPPRASKLDEFKSVIDEILRADLDAPRKQRHTVTRIYERLMAEHGMREVSYSVVRRYVADRKPKIRAEAGRGPVNVFFPQTHRAGEEAEVDFGEVTIWLRGEPVTCMLFALRLSFSGKAVHRVLLPVGPRRSWRATSTPSPRWEGSRPARSAMTTYGPQSPRSLASPGNGSRQRDGRRFVRTSS
ncbi:hypothetical protein [Actinoplanes sp. TBRC 11911]|uniref:hypothetical protein n=1 Tax=Actinoplanes sp. TBRC 11911 TaxID=2729386 RepID=UPI001B7D515C|nr:hypothetical protein [Actinoplanes sp. TBRC 11911]